MKMEPKKPPEQVSIDAMLKWEKNGIAKKVVYKITNSKHAYVIKEDVYLLKGNHYAYIDWLKYTKNNV